MCLCFPEFSGKYVYDDIMCFYTAFCCYYYRGPEAGSSTKKKLFIESFFSDGFFSETFFRHPRTQLKPLALIAKTGSIGKILSHLLSIFDRKICFEKGIKIDPRERKKKKLLCCAFVKLKQQQKILYFIY